MLFTIWFINLNFYVILDHKNLKYKNLFDDIAIDFLSFWNFTNTKDIIRTYNSTNRFQNLHPIKIYKKNLKGFSPY